MLTYKTVPFELRELKAEGDLWTFTGYSAVFGNVDFGGDRIMPGAFDKTLAARARRPLLWQHNIEEPIGLEKSLIADEHGLLGTWQIIPTQRGSDAYQLLKAGAIDAMSIGYFAEDVAFDGAVRELLTVDLAENSVVSLGMNERALITAVKAADERKYMGGSDAPDGSYEARSEDLASAFRAQKIPPGIDGYAYVLATFADHFIACLSLDMSGEMTYWDTPYVVNADGTVTLGTAVEVDEVTTFVPVTGKGLSYDLHAARVEQTVREFVERTKAGSAMRRESKEGRAISEARRTQLSAVHTGMSSHMGVIAAILDETAPKPKKADDAPPERIHIGQELRRRRLERHGIDLLERPAS